MPSARRRRNTAAVIAALPPGLWRELSAARGVMHRPPASWFDVPGFAAGLEVLAVEARVAALRQASYASRAELLAAACAEFGVEVGTHLRRCRRWARRRRPDVLSPADSAAPGDVSAA